MRRQPGGAANGNEQDRDHAAAIAPIGRAVERNERSECRKRLLKSDQLTRSKRGISAHGSLEVGVDFLDQLIGGRIGPLAQRASKSLVGFAAIACSSDLPSLTSCVISTRSCTMTSR